MPDSVSLLLISLSDFLIWQWCAISTICDWVEMLYPHLPSSLTPAQHLSLTSYMLFHVDVFDVIVRFMLTTGRPGGMTVFVQCRGWMCPGWLMVCALFLSERRVRFTQRHPGCSK